MLEGNAMLLTALDVELDMAPVRGIGKLARRLGRQDGETALDDEEVVAVGSFGMETLVDGEMFVL